MEELPEDEVGRPRQDAQANVGVLGIGYWVLGIGKISNFSPRTLEPWNPGTINKINFP